MSRAYRFTTNARPADGHLPADWATPTRPRFFCGLSAWGRALGLALFCAAAIFAAALLLHALGGGA